MKKNLYVFSALMLAGLLASCGGGVSSQSSSHLPSSSEAASSSSDKTSSSSASSVKKATIKIADNAGSVVIGKTLQLSAAYSDATADSVAWIVDKTEFATIDAAGLLTGVKDGNVSVTACSSADSSISDTVSIVVVGYSISITTTTSKVWMDDTLQLESSYSLNTITDAVTWTVDDNTVATVSETGLVTPLKTGNAKITVKNATNEKIFATKDLVIADTIIDSSKNSTLWDYSGLKSDAPTMTKSAEKEGGAMAYFKGVSGTKYMATLKANLSNPDSNDTWSRISLGNSYVNADTNEVFHGTMVSPGPGFNARKLVTGTLIAGGMQWGIETDRSQLWNVHDQAEFDYSSITLKTVRNGDDYYYFVNGELYYKEVGYTRFTGIDTIPTINVHGVDATISEMSVATESSTIDAFLDTAVAKKTLYPTYSANVAIAEDNTITFSNAPSDQQQWPFNNAKDNAAKSLGNAFSLPAGKAAKIELDLKFTSWGSDENVAALAVSMKRFDNNASSTRSFLVGKANYGFTGWDSNQNLPDGIGANNALTTPLELNTVYHIVMNRLMSGTSQDCSMTVNGDTATWGWNTEGVESTGSVALAFGARSANLIVSNIVTTIVE